MKFQLRTRSSTFSIAILLTIVINLCSSVWLDDNGGYRNVIIAIDPNVDVKNCDELRKYVEVSTKSFGNRHARIKRSALLNLSLIYKS